jgi:hypothetical protein
MRCVDEDVAVPVAAVWELLADFCNLQRWHPAVVACERSAGEEAVVRRVRFADWWAEERLELCDAALHRIEYRVIAASRTEVIGVWGAMALAELAAESTRVSWCFELPPAQGGAVAEERIAAYYRVRIDHLRAALGVETDSAAAAGSVSPLAQN